MSWDRRRNVDDDELPVRSLMMRLYRSRITGEAYYPRQFVNGEAPDLEAKGWIERRPWKGRPDDYGWRLTLDGVKAWAEMCAPVMKTQWRESSQNELMFFLGRPIKRMHLNKSSKAVLAVLVENGGEMAVDDLYQRFQKGIPLEYAVNSLNTMMNWVYVIVDGDTVMLTAVGWMIATEMNLKIVK